MRARWVTHAATVLACVAVVPRAPAQAPALVGTGGMAFADHRVDMGFGTERSSGMVFDAGLALEVGGRVRIRAVGVTGVLHPGAEATLAREVAEVGLEASYRALDWLDVESAMRVRSYTTAVGRQRWKVPSLGVVARVPFALPGMRGVLSAAVHPFATVSGLSHPEVAISSTAGMAYTRGRLGVEVVYSLDRYDFARGTVEQRLEQVSGLALRLTVRQR